MERIKIGKITAPVGLKGEVRILSFSEDPYRFEDLEYVYYSDGQKAGIQNVRYKGTQVILKLEGIEDRNASEAARGRELFMDAEDLPELEDGQYYVRDIVGFSVVSVDGEVLGELKDVLTDRAQDLYVVRPVRSEGSGGSDESDGSNKKKDLLIPGAGEIIRSVDIEEKVITVDLPDGLIDL